MSKENLILLDGSAFMFLHGNKENYEETIPLHLENIFEKHKTNKYIMYLENSETNFRIGAAKTNEYKGQRKIQREKQDEYLPFLKLVKKELKDKYKPVICSYVENDDLISLTAVHLHKEGVYNPIIAGDDSDLLVVEGDHWRLKKNLSLSVKREGSIYLNEKGDLVATGVYATYSKILKGAAKENYKGLPGYGSKKVHDILSKVNTEEEMQQLCIKHFTNIYGYKLGIEKLQEGFRLCYLLRENINFKMPDIQVYNKKEDIKSLNNANKLRKS